MVKKLLCLPSLFAFLVMTLTFNIPVASASGLIFTVSSTTASGAMTVSVSISNNPGIAAFKLFLNFDKDKLTPQKYGFTTGSAFSSIMSNITVHDDNKVDLSKLDYITATWNSVSNSFAEGLLFSVKFTITKGVSVPTVPMPVLTCAATDIVAGSGNIVEIDDSNDMIEVIKFKTTINLSPFRRNGDSVSGGLFYKIENKSGTEYATAIILAVYDNSGRMVYLKADDVNIPVHGIEHRFPNINFKSLSAKYTIKIYCWDDMQPILSPASAEVNI